MTRIYFENCSHFKQFIQSSIGSLHGGLTKTGTAYANLAIAKYLMWYNYSKGWFVTGV